MKKSATRRQKPKPNRIDVAPESDWERLFLYEEGKLYPILPRRDRRADGIRYFTAAQCAVKFGQTEQDYRDDWAEHFSDDNLQEEGSPPSRAPFRHDKLPNKTVRQRWNAAIDDPEVMLRARCLLETIGTYPFNKLMIAVLNCWNQTNEVGRAMAMLELIGVELVDHRTFSKPVLTTDGHGAFQ